MQYSLIKEGTYTKDFFCVLVKDNEGSLIHVEGDNIIDVIVQLRLLDALEVFFDLMKFQRVCPLYKKLIWTDLGNIELDLVEYNKTFSGFICDPVVEELWYEFEEVPLQEDDSEIREDFRSWKKGSLVSEIRAWFDDHHSEGIEYLLTVEWNNQ